MPLHHDLAAAWKDGVTLAGGVDPGFGLALEVANHIEYFYRNFPPYGKTVLTVVAFLHGAAYASCSEQKGRPFYATDPVAAMELAGQMFLSHALPLCDHRPFLWQDKPWPQKDEETEYRERLNTLSFVADRLERQRADAGGGM